ncbi:Ada metal-binding domain-containing protein [Nonomuraea pusilla]|uniref:Ada metal-binding domain-containing protein n=1 Tax=Nonomuraea pusilla TaxID=46177 RepID=UPI003325A383
MSGPVGTYTLVGPDGRPYPSREPGTLGGHRRARLYGRLDCPSALRALARGGYAGQRVFFPDAATARSAGYRPCSVCLPEEYAAWRSGEDGARGAEADAALRDGRAVPARPDRRTEPAADLAADPAAELAAVLALVRASVARAVVIGHGRDGGPAAEAFAAAWEGTTVHEMADSTAEGTVLAVVRWPEAAASWLRQATRFTAGEPDAWVVAGAAPGWAGMAERLRRSTAWDPRRTFGFAEVAGAVALAPPGTVEGMRGATVDGAVWRAGRALLHLDPPPAGH